MQQQVLCLSVSTLRFRQGETLFMFITFVCSQSFRSQFRLSHAWKEADRCRLCCLPLTSPVTRPAVCLSCCVESVNPEPAVQSKNFATLHFPWKPTLMTIMTHFKQLVCSNMSPRKETARSVAFGPEIPELMNLYSFPWSRSVKAVQGRARLPNRRGLEVTWWRKT